MGHNPPRVLAGEPPEHRSCDPGPAGAWNTGAIARRPGGGDPHDPGRPRTHGLGLPLGYGNRESPGASGARDRPRNHGGPPGIGAPRAYPGVRLLPRLDPLSPRPNKPAAG